MTTLRINKSTDFNTDDIGVSIDSIFTYYKESAAENRLYQYQIEQQRQILETLGKKIEALEIHRATQVGQDKIISFLVGAIVLSLLSLVTTIFFRPAEAQKQTQILQPSGYTEVAVQPHQFI